MRSLWHFCRALQRRGSGHKSSGVWPFLFLMLRSAPLDTRKHAMDALLFFSAPSEPRPISSYTHIEQRVLAQINHVHGACARATHFADVLHVLQLSQLR